MNFFDNQINIQFGGCYKSQSSCQLEWKQCLEQSCYICIDGWQMIDNRCYQICEDGQLAISSQKQCNDGCYNPYDRCYNFKFECDQNCFSCSTSNLGLFCEINFEMDEYNKCKPICGDEIIEQGLENCEDFNDIQYDGCYQFMFQCEINCSKGNCQECVDGNEYQQKDVKKY
ncbi:unnamed protein product [Paramecium primaurelia]|uniref:Uncharacterized protein n=2 Tax=Paramecium primaurelia TaxID=5886 RepID=A0A8S1PGG9_PARPR|nr:unnamed protein product [Paramecium primaurelia]